MVSRSLYPGKRLYQAQNLEEYFSGVGEKEGKKRGLGFLRKGPDLRSHADKNKRHFSKSLPEGL